MSEGTEYITHEGKSSSLDVADFLKEWGIDGMGEARGGIEGVKSNPPKSPREVFLIKIRIFLFRLTCSTLRFNFGIPAYCGMVYR